MRKVHRPHVLRVSNTNATKMIVHSQEIQQKHCIHGDSTNENSVILMLHKMQGRLAVAQGTTSKMKIESPEEPACDTNGKLNDSCNFIPPK